MSTVNGSIPLLNTYVSAGGLHLILVCAALCLAAHAQTAIKNENTVSAMKSPATSSKPTSESPSPTSNVNYADGLLTIDMQNATLQDALHSIALVTGVTIDIPPGLESERMPLIKLGPGPAREIVAALLSGSHFDYLILASDSHPDEIKSILLMPAGVKDTKPSNLGPALATQPRLLARERGPLPADTAPAADVVNTPSLDHPPSTAPDPATTDSTQTGTPVPQPPSDLPQVNAAHPGALAPPSVLTPDAINQQLQQMYLQRMQMQQQPTQPQSSVR